MAIQYDFYQQTGVRNDKEQLYTKVISNETITTEHIAELIEHSSSLTAGDVKAVLSAISQTLVQQLLSGNRVQINGLGIFSIAMGGSIQRNRDGKLWVKDAHVNDIRFRPEKQLMQKMQQAEFTSRNHVGNHSQKVSEEEIITRIRFLQQQQPFFTINQIKNSCGFTQNRAYQITHNLIKQGFLENVSPNKSYLLRIKNND